MPVSQPVHKEFDKMVHLRDKHGKQVGENHYAYHIIDGSPYFERPIGSGNLFEPNGEPCGRLVDRRKLVIESDAAHIAFQEAPEGAEKIAFELSSSREENAEILRELAALKAENERLLHASEAKVMKAAPEVTEGLPKAPSKFAQHAASAEKKD